ncbi:MAG: hypothetical protein VX899_11875 [Myxococcota bacterium]|nr:hypothetical protein [Myxococcota bacterium]
MSLLLVLQLACTPSPGEALRLALDPAAPLDEALSACQHIPAPDAQGDCLSAALETRGDYERADCEQIQARRWRDECVFLLAERQRTEGALAAAVDTCHETAFARECVFHLIRDEARLVADQTPAAAQERVAPFIGAPRAPDAAAVFWKEWATARIKTHDLPVAPETCTQVDDTVGCQDGLKRAGSELLRGIPSKQRCERVEAGEPVLQLASGEPSLVPASEQLRAATAHCD